MIDDLKKIMLDLRKWCKKYGKGYMSIAFINNNLISCADNDDEDRDKLDLFLNGEDIDD